MCPRHSFRVVLYVIRRLVQKVLEIVWLLTSFHASAEGGNDTPSTPAMDSLGYLLRSKSSRFLFILVILQSTYILLFQHRSSQHAETQHVTTSKHTSAAKILAENVSITDFGLMGKKVAALGDLAKHYVDNAHLDPSRMNEVLAEQFPWWDGSKLPYYPWRKKSLRESSFSDLNPFGPKTGIVVSSGNGGARMVAHSIVTLRDVHKSRLPVHIAYVGDRDLHPLIRTWLSQLRDDVHFIDLKKVYDERLVHLGGYATKPFALLASPYPQTILMDADTVYFESPDDWFKSYPGLRDTGAFFFHDRAMANDDFHRQNWVAAQREASGFAPSEHATHSSLFQSRIIAEETDSAIVCIDKSRPEMYMAMVFACWMNVREVLESVTYRMFIGDKESYWLAAELSGVPYAFEPWSSARLAMNAPTYIDYPPGNTDEGSQDSKTWKRRSARDLVFAELETDSDYEAPPVTGDCTNHMVHVTGSGHEPAWANGGLWVDKGDIRRGLANWTYWYLGDRNDEVISEFDLNSNNPYDRLAAGEEDDATVKAQIDKVMATQPIWTDDHNGCPQPDQSRWKRLSPEFLSRFARILAAVKEVDIRWQREVG